MINIFIEPRLGAWLHDSGTSGISSSPLLLHRVPLQRRAGHQIQTELCITEFPNRSLLGNSTEIINQLWNSTYTHTPNSLHICYMSKVLLSEEDLKLPKELHPIFYGCFDWHRLRSCLVFNLMFCLGQVGKLLGFQFYISHAIFDMQLILIFY